jgi:hypothetical protein
MPFDDLATLIVFGIIILALTPILGAYIANVMDSTSSRWPTPSKRSSAHR